MLNIKERNFLDNIVLNNMDRVIAYRMCFNVGEDVTDEIVVGRISRMLDKQDVKDYYSQLVDSINSKKQDEAAWGLEQSTALFKEMIDTLKTQAEDKKRYTKSEIDGILTSAKELNAMYGLNEKNINITGHQVVQFYGEEDLQD